MPASIAMAIPSLNQGRFLEDAVRSLTSQTGVELQVAFVDGGSTDETHEIVSRYKAKMSYLRSFADNGQAAAINEGIVRLPATSYVGWLNSDDLLLPDGLKAMASFLDRSPGYVAVFAKAYIIDEEGKVVGQYPTRPFDQRKFAVRCTICQPASLIRRSAWDQAGGLDESIQTCIDYDLWWRLSKIGSIGYLEEFVACSRDHPRSKTRTKRKQVNEEAISILLRYRGMVPKNWCMANILEGVDFFGPKNHWLRWWKAFMRYVQINGWKAILPQNWLG